MQELQPFNFKENKVRVILNENNEPWFVTRDVCGVLGIKRIDNANRFLDKDERGTHNVRTLGGNQNMSIMSESGLYSIILRARKPEAQQFKRWVTHEVLPTIRKTGKYSVNEMPDRKQLAQMVLDAENEKEKYKKELEQAQPELDYNRKVLSSVNTYTTTQIAKELGMKSAKELNKILHEKRVQYKQNGQWVLYAQHQGKGYIDTRTYTYEYGDKTGTNNHTVWTEKGRKFIHHLLNKRLNGKTRQTEMGIQTH